MVNMLSNDYNLDAQMILRINRDLCNLLYHVKFIASHFEECSKKIGKENKILIFDWFILKTIAKFETDGRGHQLAQSPYYRDFTADFDIFSSIRKILNLSPTAPPNQIL